MKIQRVFSAMWFTYALVIIAVIFSLFLGSQSALAGGEIIFSKSMIGLGKIQIVILTDGSSKRAKNLSNSDVDDFQPSWSFDGRHIAFVSDRNGALPDGPVNICIMDADGSNQYQVTKTTTNKGLWECYPSFSPNGKRLAFTRATDWKFIQGAGISPHYKIYTIDFDGNNERYLADGYCARWSPDGKKIAFGNHGGGGIYTMDTDGKNQVKITDNGYYPSWSLDSKYIAFSYHNENVNGFEICKMDSDGGNIVHLTNGVNQDIEPSWSPDGKYIVFTRVMNNGDPSGIYRVNADGGTSVLIYDDYSECPSWFDPAFAKYAVNQTGKLADTWGGIKIR